MILTFIEHAEGKPDTLSLEMLTMACQLSDDLGEPVHAILIGRDVAAAAGTLPAHGVRAVYAVEKDELATYAPDAWAKSIVAVIESRNPAVVLGSGSDRSHDVLARVAARLDLPLCANAQSIQTGSVFHITRVCWGGSLYEEVTLDAPIKLLTIAPHVVEPVEVDAGHEPEMIPVDVDLAPSDWLVRVVDRVAPEKEGISLADAPVVVGGGRGVGSAEGFAALDELAGLVDGAVGCSRAVTSNGWRPHADQIGQTGERIAPQLYIACGISGASQHMAGASGAKHLLAINIDKEAPILSKANFAVIGDLHEVLPAIVAEIKQRR